MSLRHSSALIALVLLTGACASGIDSAVFMNAQPLPPDADVRIHRTTVPDCPYDELGLITWRPMHGFQKLQTGVDRMRDRAREMGGHAIIGFSIGERQNGTTTTINSDSTSVVIGSSVDTETTVSGTVVRYRDGGCPR